MTTRSRRSSPPVLGTSTLSASAPGFARCRLEKGDRSKVGLGCKTYGKGQQWAGQRDGHRTYVRTRLTPRAMPMVPALTRRISVTSSYAHLQGDPKLKSTSVIETS